MGWQMSCLEFAMQWRRWIQRAQELGLTTPDPLALVQVGNRVTEALGRHGGAQVSLRMATARQDLAVDQCPTMESIMEYAEYTQAEAEDLALMAGSSKAPTACGNVNASTTGGTAPKVAAFNTMNSTEEKPKAPCKFWGSAQGCRRGDQCTYGHSWDGINKQNRCFVCSGEGHMSRECPTRRERDQKDSKKVAKVKNPSPTKESPANDIEAPDRSKEEIATTTTSQQSSGSLKSTQASRSRDGEKVGGGGEASTGSAEPAAALIAEATSLLKSLRALKACRLKQVCRIQPGTEQEGEVALLDGGATHPLRMAEEGEKGHLIPVQVELAHGSTTLFRVVFGCG